MEKVIDKILLASDNINKLNEINSFFDGKIKFILPKEIGIYHNTEENGLDFNENSILKIKEFTENIDIPILADDSGLVVKLLSQFVQKIKEKPVKSHNEKNTENQDDYQIHIDKIIRYFSEFCNPSIKKKVEKFWNDYLPSLKLFPGVVSKRFGYIEDEKERNHYLVSLLKYLSNSENIKKIFVKIDEEIERNITSNFYTKDNIKAKIPKIKNIDDLSYDIFFPAYFETSLALKYNGKIYHFNGISEGFIVDKPSGTNGFGYDPIFFYPPLGKTYAQLTMEEKNEVSHRAKALIKLKEFIEKQI